MEREQIKRQKRETEGGKSFERLQDMSENLYYIVYDSNMNMVTESKEKEPLSKGNVVDSLHSAFGAPTYKEMIAEAKKLGIKR
jgi:hypothetical protein